MVDPAVENSPSPPSSLAEALEPYVPPSCKSIVTNLVLELHSFADGNHIRLFQAFGDLLESEDFLNLGSDCRETAVNKILENLKSRAADPKITDKGARLSGQELLGKAVRHAHRLSYLSPELLAGFLDSPEICSLIAKEIDFDFRAQGAATEPESLVTSLKDADMICASVLSNRNTRESFSAETCEAINALLNLRLKDETPAHIAQCNLAARAFTLGCQMLEGRKEGFDDDAACSLIIFSLRRSNRPRATLAGYTDDSLYADSHLLWREAHQQDVGHIVRVMSGLLQSQEPDSRLRTDLTQLRYHLSERINLIRRAEGPQQASELIRKFIRQAAKAPQNVLEDLQTWRPICPLSITLHAVYRGIESVTNKFDKNKAQMSSAACQIVNELLTKLDTSAPDARVLLLALARYQSRFVVVAQSFGHLSDFGEALQSFDGKPTRPDFNSAVSLAWRNYGEALWRICEINELRPQELKELPKVDARRKAILSGIGIALVQDIQLSLLHSGSFNSPSYRQGLTANCRDVCNELFSQSGDLTPLFHQVLETFLHKRPKYASKGPDRSHSNAEAIALCARTFPAEFQSSLLACIEHYQPDEESWLDDEPTAAAAAELLLSVCCFQPEFCRNFDRTTVTALQNQNPAKGLLWLAAYVSNASVKTRSNDSPLLQVIRTFNNHFREGLRRHEWT